jgi:hypothetical protein
MPLGLMGAGGVLGMDGTAGGATGIDDPCDPYDPYSSVFLGDSTTTGEERGVGVESGVVEFDCAVGPVV